MNYYMHLLDGQPGIFDDRTGRICYAGKACTNLATSLKQLRSEQRSAANCDIADKVGPFRYSYVRIPGYALGKTGEQS